MRGPAVLRLGIVAAVALAVLVIAFVTRRGWGEDAIEPAAGIRPALVGEPATVGLTEAELAPATASDRRSAPAEAVAERAPDGPRAVVLGRCVDEADAPLAGVLVTLQGYKGWAEGFEAPRLEAPYDLRGWTLETAVDGAFRFEVPVPTVAITWMTIEPDLFHAEERVDFGGKRSGAREPLEAGLRDLGDFRLVTTGAIRGRVTDAGGAPIAGADLDVGDTPSTTYGYGARSDATGEYLIKGVPAGSYGVEAEADAFLSKFEKPVVVERLQITEGLDFALDRSPTLRGRVVDVAGVGIEGVRVWGSPASSGSGARADSDANGDFVVYLPQDEPYTLELTCDGYQPIGVGDYETHYEPGTHDLHFVMPADLLTTFVVVDPEGAPVTSFGLRINRNAGRDAPIRNRTSFMDPPRPKPRPEGRAEVGARPGLDTYEVYTPGFLEANGEVAHDGAGSNVQTVSLRRGASVFGRVVEAGEPVEGAVVVVTPGFVQQRASAAGEELQRFFGRHAEAQSVTTGADGVFRVPGARRGHYQVLAERRDLGVVLRVPIECRGGDTDLGDLELEPYGRIAGRVIVPQGVRSAGVQVYLDDWKEQVIAVTDVDGAFRFEQVAPGAHALDVDGLPGLLGDGEPFAVEVPVGGVAEPVLDVTARGMCAVTLHVTLGGAPAEGLDVYLLPIAEPEEELELDEADASGRVSDSVRAAGEARVMLRTAAGVRIVHPSARVLLERGEEVEQQADFECASLALQLPAGLVLPENARVELALDLGGDEPVEVRVRLSGGAVTRPLKAATFADGLLTVEQLPLGAGTLQFRLLDGDREAEPVDLGGGSRTWRIPPELELGAPVALEAGQRASVDLR